MKISRFLSRLCFGSRPSREISIRERFVQFLVLYAPFSLLISLIVATFYETNSTTRNFRNFSSIKINELSAQTELAETTTAELQKAMDETAKTFAERVASFVQNDPSILVVPPHMSDYQQSGLGKLALVLDLDEINVTDETGTVIAAYPSDGLGTNFDDPPLNEFLQLIDNPELTIVQPVRLSRSNPAAGMFLYSGKGRRDARGFVEVGIRAERLRELFKIGEVEKFISRNPDENNPFAVFRDGKFIGGAEWLKDAPCEKMGKNKIFVMKGKKGYFLVHSETRGRYWFVCAGSSRMLVRKNLIGLLWATVANFFILFSILLGGSYLIDRFIVSSILKLNGSLEKIANGDLNETVEVRNTREFSSLSDEVNSTVQTLKDSMEEIKRKADDELELARKIQVASLPDLENRYARDDRFDVFAVNRPMHMVGGDMYDFFFVDDARAMFYVADVSGHGVGASLLMMKTMALVKNLVLSGNGLARTVEVANERLAENNESMFVTGFFCLIDLTTGKTEYVNAGHNPPFLRRKGGRFEEISPEINLILGVSADEKYQSAELELSPGDELMLYMDGITEATAPDLDCFETGRALGVLNSVDESASAKETARRLFEAIAEFVGSDEPSDDETLLLFKLRRIGR